MANLPLIDPDTANGEVADLFSAVKGALGAVPNMTRAMANSPALLSGYLGLSGALRKGVLDGATRELIALTVAQGNVCEYCLSAHSYLAEHVAHLDAAQIADARAARSTDPKTAAILTVAAAVNEGRGSLPDQVLADARAAGVSDAEIAETIGHVGLNVLTNYVNKAAAVDIDFPHVKAGE